MSKKIVMVGLPETGKTTFSAALWHVVVSREVMGSMQLVRLQDETEYLSKIRSTWLGFEDMERTQIDDEGQIKLLLNDVTGDTVELDFTDMSGERFKSQWEDRQWDSEYASLADEIDGLLLFIHPRKIVSSVRIRDAQMILELIGEEEEEEESHEIFVSPEAEWTHALATTQIKNIDLIQFLVSGRLDGRHLRTSVIISAWDWVQKTQKVSTPFDYLKTSMPMLFQYLNSNVDVLHPRVFGVSAQGGELSNKDDLEKLGNCVNASDRISVVWGTNSSSDLTQPLRWAMGTSEVVKE